MARYDDFLKEFAELTLDKYDGSLKAEHGTGVNMAPFVRHEWGDRAYGLMWRIKDLMDPKGILAPGVKLSRDDRIHIKHFKSHPRIEAVANACVECGFCESVCPSRYVTETPRQRIVVRREMARQPEHSPVLEQLHNHYGYDAIDTCAADSTCSVACPISIDTGKMMKLFRELEATRTEDRSMLALAKNWAKVETAGRAGLGAAAAVRKVLGNSVGNRVLGSLTDVLRTVISEDIMYSARDGIPGPASGKLPRTGGGAKAAGALPTAVYFPACINRMFGRQGSAAGHGPSADNLSLPETLVALSRRAGKPLTIPDDVAGSCCGTPFSSKGYRDAKQFMAERVARNLWRWSDHGRLPVVVDAASCTHGILENIPEMVSGELAEQFSKVRVIDAVTWAKEELLPELEVHHPLGRVVVHPTCSMQHLGIVEDFLEVAGATAEDVVVPLGAACCGTAGDRALLHPELGESATRDERAGVALAEEEGPVDAYLSDNRTCELGMEQQTGRNYEHILYALERATR